MGKPTICIGENKGADQLRGNREADQCLCFRYTDSTIPPLLKFKISSFQLSSVLVQPSLCRTCSETTLLVFLWGGSYKEVNKYLVKIISLEQTISKQFYLHLSYILPGIRTSLASNIVLLMKRPPWNTGNSSWQNLPFAYAKKRRRSAVQ